MTIIYREDLTAAERKMIEEHSDGYHDTAEFWIALSTFGDLSIKNVLTSLGPRAVKAALSGAGQGCLVAPSEFGRCVTGVGAFLVRHVCR